MPPGHEADGGARLLALLHHARLLGRAPVPTPLHGGEDLQHTVFERLKLQLVEAGACCANAEVRLCLACGRISSDADRSGLHRHFAAKGWELWDEPWLRERLKHMANRGYENQVSAV